MLIVQKIQQPIPKMQIPIKVFFSTKAWESSDILSKASICQLHTIILKTALTGSKQTAVYEKNWDSLFLNWLFDLMNKLKYSFSEKTKKICAICLMVLMFTKGQLISKAIYGLLTSPKKQTDEFVLFAFLLFTTNKSNSSVRFLGESTARQSAFRN